MGTWGHPAPAQRLAGGKEENPASQPPLPHPQQRAESLCCQRPGLSVDQGKSFERRQNLSLNPTLQTPREPPTPGQEPDCREWPAGPRLALLRGAPASRGCGLRGSVCGVCEPPGLSLRGPGRRSRRQLRGCEQRVAGAPPSRRDEHSCGSDISAQAGPPPVAGSLCPRGTRRLPRAARLPARTAAEQRCREGDAAKRGPAPPHL